MESLIVFGESTNNKDPFHFIKVIIFNDLGTLSPLLGIGAQVSLQFGSN
jgi:hypothetical protein